MRPGSPKPRRARLRSPTRFSGRSATGRSRISSSRSGATSSTSARRPRSRRCPGAKRPMRDADLDAILRRAHRGADGSYRAIAARAVPGRPVGGFRYYGTRPDDPNDIVPHEHRRELRALKVFGAWTNLVDMKAGNTLDAVVVENGRSVVRHYLQDVGSTFGTGANGPREYDEGWELLYDGDLMLKRLVTLGFFIAPWQTVDIRRASGDRTLRGRCIRSGVVASTRRDRGVPSRARRRYFLGGTPCRRLHRRDDPGGREIRRLLGSRRRRAPERRADQAARQDRRRVSSFDQSARRFRPRWRRHS